MAQVPDAISILTPIGVALPGQSTGDTIHWPRPEPERAGEYFR